MCVCAGDLVSVGYDGIPFVSSAEFEFYILALSICKSNADEIRAKFVWGRSVCVHFQLPIGNYRRNRKQSFIDEEFIYYLRTDFGLFRRTTYVSQFPISSIH